MSNFSVVIVVITMIIFFIILHFLHQNPPSTVAGLLKMALDAVTYSRVAVIMLAGGHFAAAVFDGYE